MKTYSVYSDDGMTIMVIADSEEQAVDKTADKIAEIGIEIDLDYFEDDLNDAYITDDETVSDWLIKNGIAFTEDSMIVMEYNDIDQSVRVVEL